MRFAPVRVAAAGYLGDSDRPYLAKIITWLGERGWPTVSISSARSTGPQKIHFLQSLDALSLPTVHPESKGLPVLEAWANGIPAVLPAHGVFPELIEDTGGGLLCKPDDARSLADALKRLIQDPALTATCGRRGQEAVHDRYHAELMAQQTIALYEQVVACR